MAYVSKNPATEEVLMTVEEISDDVLRAKVAKAEAVFATWRFVPVEERARLLMRAAELFRERAREYGELVAKEMGRPIAAAVAEIEKCAAACDYYAKNAASMLASERVATEASQSYVRFDPLGIVLAVMPWNYPFWQAVRFAAPALVGGNVGLLKHASNVPQCAAALERVFADAGFPDGAFQNLYIGSARIADLIRNPAIRAVTLTGSEAAGKSVASVAGTEIKKVVLELGGSDPFIVLADADLEAAVAGATASRLQNAGQSCISAKRFIVDRSVAEKFVSLLRDRFASIKIGDPMDPAVGMGPLASEQIRTELERQVAESVSRGATIACGGKRADGKGYFYEPTILTGIKKGMPAYDEELFGPVAAVIVVDGTDEAIRVANDTAFGLGASVWTRNVVAADAIASRIDAGCVFVNAMVKSDPRLPFGGIKTSGIGRELSHYGLREFQNVKTVLVA